MSIWPGLYSELSAGSMSVLHLWNTLLLKRMRSVAFVAEKIHRTKFFILELTGDNFLLKMKTFKINTIKLVYSWDSCGISRLNLDRCVSLWILMQDLSDFWPRIISNLDLHVKTNSPGGEQSRKRLRKWVSHEVKWK